MSRRSVEWRRKEWQAIKPRVERDGGKAVWTAGRTLGQAFLLLITGQSSPRMADKIKSALNGKQ